MIATSLASAARPLWRLLERSGIDAASVFREAALDPTLLDEPRGRYGVERAAAAWSLAAQRLDDPCLGLKVAEVWSPTDLHALGCAFLASRSLGTALGRICRYGHVVSRVIEFELADEGDRLALTFRTEDPAYLQHLTTIEDIVWAHAVSLCRAASGAQFNPAEVRFQHQEPPCSADYDRLFRCPVRFGAQASAMLFARTDAERPLPAANRELARANDRILSEFLEQLGEGDLVQRVKAAIANELPSGSPSDEEIAELMYMSPRTLQRKLAADGTTYSKLLDAVRRNLAEQYITDPSLSLSEVSFLLGFSEQSAFSRAYRRWTGTAPSTARSPTAS